MVNQLLLSVLVELPMRKRESIFNKHILFLSYFLERKGILQFFSSPYLLSQRENISYERRAFCDVENHRCQPGQDIAEFRGLEGESLGKVL